VSVGNTADLTPNDLLLYWDQEPGTDLIRPTWNRCPARAGSPGASPGTLPWWW
jgi:hypothetical protein